MQTILNYINGKMVPASSGKTLPNYNPALGKPFGTLPDSDQEDVDEAINAAENASNLWLKMGEKGRSAVLLKIADLIEANLHVLALAESTDNGKPVKLATKVDIPRAAANIRFYATAITHFSTESHYSQELNAVNYTMRHPVGVVGCISPWNLPLYLFTWKIAPALASGCTVVAKPSEITPYTAFLFSQLCIEAGLPSGVLNIVHGLGSKVGNAIVDDNRVKAISFTGDTVTGATIAPKAAPKFKKLSLELGGKNPNLVFNDCNLSEAVRTSVLSSFTNQGEICLCGSRIYLQSGIYEAFKAQFLERVAKLKVGDPTAPDTNIGAIVSQQHYEKVLSYIALAKAEGGSVLYGGNAVVVDGDCKQGWFIEPTVIEGLSTTCRTNQEEIFGPVVTIMPFDTDEEAVALANATPYGLACTIWTQDVNKAHSIGHQIKCGIVWVNCWMVRDLRTPFGGMKQSGVGREGGWEALKFFTEAQNMCIQL